MNFHEKLSWGAPANTSARIFAAIADIADALPLAQLDVLMTLWERSHRVKRSSRSLPLGRSGANAHVHPGGSIRALERKGLITRVSPSRRGDDVFELTEAGRTVARGLALPITPCHGLPRMEDRDRHDLLLASLCMLTMANSKNKAAIRRQCGHCLHLEAHTGTDGALRHCCALSDEALTSRCERNQCDDYVPAPY